MTETIPNQQPVTQPVAPAAPVVDPKDAQIAALQKQLDETKNGWEADRTVLQRANYILETVTQDPNLTGLVKTAVEKRANPAPTPEAPATPTVPPQTPMNPQTPAQPPISEESLLMRENIVKNVENAYGISNLPEDQKKEMRKKIAQRLATYGMDVTKVPLNQLETVLKDQYLLENIPKATEDGRMQGLIEAHSNQYGALPNMSNTPTNQEAPQVTQDQKKWADKLGVSLDKVESNLKELEETGKVVYKPREEQPQNQPQPSGTPQYPGQPS